MVMDRPLEGWCLGSGYEPSLVTTVRFPMVSKNLDLQPDKIKHQNECKSNSSGRWNYLGPKQFLDQAPECFTLYLTPDAFCLHLKIIRVCASFVMNRGVWIFNNVFCRIWFHLLI
jgi:hypothetical protein